MKTRGRILDIKISYPSHRAVISFEVAAKPEDCEKYIGKDLNVSFTQYREHRSLTQNGYYWALLTQVAKVQHISLSCLHNMLLREYGQPLIIAGQLVRTPIPDTEEAENIALEASTFHIRPTSEVREGKDGILYRTYIFLRGSHEYDTAEMTRLIDGLVEMAKESGVETLTPDELRRLAQYDTE